MSIPAASPRQREDGTHLDERVRRARDLGALLGHRRLQIVDLLVEQPPRLHRVLVVLVLIVILVALVVLLVFVIFLVILVVPEREVELCRELLVDVALRLVVLVARRPPAAVVAPVVVALGERAAWGRRALAVGACEAGRGGVQHVLVLDQLRVGEVRVDVFEHVVFDFRCERVLFE